MRPILWDVKIRAFLSDNWPLLAWGLSVVFYLAVIIAVSVGR